MLATKNLHLLALQSVTIDIDNQTFVSNNTSVVKTLGVHLDPNLSMGSMISNCVSVCYFNLKNLQTIRNSLDQNTKIFLVKTLILNRLDYCNILLANATATNIQRLQRVLNACVRFIFNLRKSDHVTNYAKQCHFLPVKYRIRFKSCVTVFKMANECAPEYLSPFVQYNLPARDNLRSNNDVLIFKLPRCEKSIKYKMISDWNTLPAHLRYITSLEDFKANLKTHLFRIAYDS